jgi:hypothetical protein
MNAYFQHFFYLEKKNETQGGQGKRQARNHDPIPKSEFSNSSAAFIIIE